MPHRKKTLRAVIGAAIAAMSAAERMERSVRAQARLTATPEFQAARTVMVYHADPTEVDTHELVQACLLGKKRVSLPRMEKGTRAMQVREILDPKRDLETSRFGSIKEPRAILPLIALETIDLVVVPGRAFDAHGNRLGRGGGYYDRFFARPQIRAKAAALAFDCQIVAAVPSLDHDRPVDLIVTESRVVRPERT